MIASMISTDRLHEIAKHARLPLAIVINGIEIITGDIEDETDAANFCYYNSCEFIGAMIRDSYRDAHAA